MSKRIVAPPLCAFVCFMLSVVMPLAYGNDDRQNYREAIAKLRSGDHEGFNQLAASLRHYMLYPYLKYHALNSRLSSANRSAILDFLKNHQALPVQPILKRRWLRRLGNERNWTLFLEHYEIQDDAQLNCYYLRALYGTGQQELALSQTAEAWIKAESQPKACDPLFDVWRKSSYFTDPVIWQRLELALAANEVTLARYLVRQFDSGRDVAEQFYDAHVRPRRIIGNSEYQQNSPRHRQIMQHVLPRLARQDPEAALKTWRSLGTRMGFSEGELSTLRHRLARALATEEHFPEVAERALITEQDTIHTLMQLAVQQQRWPEVIYWAEALNEPQAHQPEVQYWLARALQLSTGEAERARLGLRSLAERRHYYGFWAAQYLGIPGQLNANPVYDQRTAVTRLRNKPNFARSLELFAIGDELNGRREWYAGLATLSPLDQRVAAELALANGLLPLTITTANHANAEHALHLRFPVAYLPQYRRASLDTGVEVPTLLAVTRQESAWDHRAVSHANAYGLMQLLPSTARLVARRFQLRPPTTTSLHDPGTNIALGSRHLAWLLDRYDGQLIPAMAAYNAGEHRADRWLRERDDMPLDVWIETIPFRETRNYVKNALAFRHVYAQLIGSPLPFVNREQLRTRAR
ncbi:MAG: transglycosylase SLT domain-containing protein [Pseudomonadales bacterium]